MNTSQEKRSVMALAAIMSIRMLGLFMILPVFSVYATKMPGATPTLVGLALGIYGLTQALLQIPFGMASDHVGRKPIIIIGLTLFCLGSIVAALSHTMPFLIFGRALQGAGAVGSTVLALLADLTRDESRSKAMAFMGLSIGSAFTFAMVLGPIINSWFQLGGIFWATAILALVGITILIFAIPSPPKPITRTTVGLRKRFSAAIANKELLKLDWGIFSLHTILTAMFIAIPFVLFHKIKLSEWEQVSLYLGVLITSFVAALPLIIIAEKKRKMKTIFIAAVTTIFLVEFTLSITTHTALLTGLLLFVFFTAFTFLEATLPSWVSKVAPIEHKGAAMGVYSSSQFFGIFIGGSIGGVVFSHAHLTGIFVFCAVVALIWVFVANVMSQPPYLSTLISTLNTEKTEAEIQDKLSPIQGIDDIAVVESEGLLYVKIDKKKISENELRDLLRAGNLTK